MLQHLPRHVSSLRRGPAPRLKLRRHESQGRGVPDCRPLPQGVRADGDPDVARCLPRLFSSPAARRHRVQHGRDGRPAGQLDDLPTRRHRPDIEHLRSATG